MCLMFSLTFYNTERIDKRQYLLIKNEDRQTTDKRTDIQTFNQVFFLSLLVILLRFFILRILRTLFLFFFLCVLLFIFYQRFFRFFFLTLFLPRSFLERIVLSFFLSLTHLLHTISLSLSLPFIHALTLSLSLSCSPLSMRIINRVSLHRYHRYLTRRFLSRFKSDVSPETLPSTRGFLIIVVYSPQSLPLTSLYLFFSCSSFLLSRTKSRVERLSKLTILGKEPCGRGLVVGHFVRIKLNDQQISSI